MPYASLASLAAAFVAGAAVSWQALGSVSGGGAPVPSHSPSSARPTLTAEVSAGLAAEAAARAARGGSCLLPPSHDTARPFSLPLTDSFGKTLNLEAVTRPWGPEGVENRFGPRSEVVELVAPPADAAAFLRDFVLPGVPFVLRGYAQAAGWDAPGRWTDAYLRETVGHLTMPLRTSKFNDGTYHYAHGLSATEDLPVSDFIDRVNSSEAGRYYLAQGDLFGGRAPGPMAALLDDIAAPPWAAALDLKHINLWFGAATIRNPAHYDANENILVMIAGRKTLTLFPPGARNFLEPRMHGEHSAPLTQMVDVDAVNDTQWPCFRFARDMSTTVVLEDGDALYIPPYWWHQVISEGRSLAVNFWYSVHSALLSQMMKSLDHSLLLEPDDESKPAFTRQRVW